MGIIDLGSLETALETSIKEAQKRIDDTRRTADKDLREYWEGRTAGLLEARDLVTQLKITGRIIP